MAHMEWGAWRPAQDYKSINWKQAFSFKPVACTVCGQACSQFYRCMHCREWVHVKCTEDGVCNIGCLDAV
jgi:hypothetical protein